MKSKVDEKGRNIIERNIVINATHIRVKSVFNGEITLEKALGNIAKQRLTESVTNDKS